MPSPEFELATIEVEKVNQQLSNDDMLQVSASYHAYTCSVNANAIQLYALYKQATGASFVSASKPGMFDMVVCR